MKLLLLIFICSDGSTYAYTSLDLEGKGFDKMGDHITDFEHLRQLNLNKNGLDNIDKLRNLKYLQHLEAANNKIADNYFMSESKQQLKFLTHVNLSNNKLTKLRQILCTKLLTLKLDSNAIEEVDMVGHGSLKSLSM